MQLPGLLHQTTIYVNEIDVNKLARCFYSATGITSLCHPLHSKNNISSLSLVRHIIVRAVGDRFWDNIQTLNIFKTLISSIPPWQDCCATAAVGSVWPALFLPSFSPYLRSGQQQFSKLPILMQTSTKDKQQVFSEWKWLGPDTANTKFKHDFKVSISRHEWC